MKSYLVIGFALSLAFLTGCAQLPTQTGTWTGIGVPVILYTADGRGVEVVALHIEQGPTMGDSSYRGRAFGPAKGSDRENFIAKQPIIVDAKSRSFSPAAVAGHKLQIRGTVLATLPKDSATGEELFRATAKQDPTFTTAALAVIKTSKSRILDLGPVAR